MHYKVKICKYIKLIKMLHENKDDTYQMNKKLLPIVSSYIRISCLKIIQVINRQFIKYHMKLLL